MKFSGAHGARTQSVSRIVMIVLMLTLLTWMTPSVGAAETVSVIQVEEDWELVVREPEIGVESPQVTCVTSPVGHLDSLYASFDLNHRSVPAYISGGLQLQVWNDEELVDDKSPSQNELLCNAGETIRWTQQMSVQNQRLTFEIVDGSSTTWGQFGGGNLKVTVDAALDDLNAYDPAVSIARSGIGFASNRVSSLTLKRVRLYTASGEMVVREIDGVVHSHE